MVFSRGFLFVCQPAEVCLIASPDCFEDRGLSSVIGGARSDAVSRSNMGFDFLMLDSKLKSMTVPLMTGYYPYFQLL